MLAAFPIPVTWAVHLADGTLTGPWLLGGFALLGLLGLLSVHRLAEEEIPQVALLTALFFVASSLHVPAGPVRVHLLLNGLIGLVAPCRAALVIPIGLLLQAALIGHGGFSTLGVNSCVMTLPALFAGLLFRATHAIPWAERPWARTGLVAFGAVVWLVNLVGGIALLVTNAYWDVLLNPITVAALLVAASFVVWVERWLDHPPEFAVGLLAGSLTVQLTVLLNCLVLVWGGQEDWYTLAVGVFLAHLPVAAIEGVVLGFVVGFLTRVTAGTPHPVALPIVPDRR